MTTAPTQRRTPVAHTLSSHSHHFLTPTHTHTCRRDTRLQLITGLADTHTGQRERRPPLTAGDGFVGAVGAVGSSVAVPVGGDAAAAGAAELALGTGGRRCGEEREITEGTWLTRDVRNNNQTRRRICEINTVNSGKLTTVRGALVAHVPAVVVSVAQVRPRDADVGGLTFGLLGLARSLRCDSRDHRKQPSRFGSALTLRFRGKHF